MHHTLYVRNLISPECRMSGKGKKTVNVGPSAAEPGALGRLPQSAGSTPGSSAALTAQGEGTDDRPRLIEEFNGAAVKRYDGAVTYKVKEIVSCIAVINVYSGMNKHKYILELTSGERYPDDLSLKFINDPLKMFNKSKFEDITKTVNQLWEQKQGLEVILKEIRVFLQPETGTSSTA